MRRRQALKLLALAPAGWLLRGGLPGAAAAERLIPVPPTVMLHARQAHLDNMARLLDWLAAHSYTPITYRALWASLAAKAPLPPQPVILTIDDLTLVRGSLNFPFIARMIAILLAREVPAVVSIVTEPVISAGNGQLVQLRQQDDSLWAQAAAWQARGIELATHTRSHRNLAEAGMPRDELEAEIARSAALITARTGEAVRTLVLPFGNGATDSQAGALRDSIAGCCRGAGIGIVAGVSGGRAPLIPASPDQQPVYFVGRVGPVEGSYSSIFWEIEHWNR